MAPCSRRARDARVHARMPLFLLQPALASLVSPPGIQSHRWIRAGGQQSIAYERAGAGAAAAVGGPPVLLLNGFGVGSFHWHRVMEPLARESGSVCYGMDYLGQGGSWPVDCAEVCLTCLAYASQPPCVPCVLKRRACPEALRILASRTLGPDAPLHWRPRRRRRGSERGRPALCDRRLGGANGGAPQ